MTSNSVLKVVILTIFCFLNYQCQILDTPSVTLPSISSIVNDVQQKWEEFKREFNKSYTSHHHERKALDAWTNNLAIIDAHNALNLSYKLRANHLSDMSVKEYLRRVIKLIKSNHHSHDTYANHSIFRNENDDIPEEIDWREAGFQPTILSQKRCGACYAFSVAHALQAQAFISKSKWIPLSEQQIVDCGTSYGNYGCGGGSLKGGFRYLAARGAMSARDYPYTAKKGDCLYDRRDVKVRLSSWGVIPRRDEEFLEKAVALVGPIAVSINAAPHTFQLYHSGVYDDEDCTDEHVNHAVLIVGYTKSHWIILNWWGENWGEAGYMRIQKGVNQCGISNLAAYVIIE